MTIDVLFICTANSARSIMCESVLNGLGGGRFRGWSAGSHPSGRVNPMALDMLAKHGYPIAGVRSKAIDEFVGPDAPRLDFVITVCDNAAREACPIFPGKPVSAHWGMPDPAAIADDEARRQAFAQTLVVVQRRVQAFTSLPFASIDKSVLGAELRAIGAL